MADKMITNDDIKNYTLFRLQLEVKLNEPTNQNSI